MRSAATLILVTAITGIGLSTNLASAADVPVKARVPAPLPAAVTAFGWSGFYIGGHLGYARADSDTSTTHLPAQDTFDALPFRQTTDLKGWLGGVQAGYNWNMGGYILGFEVDWSDSHVDGTSQVAPLLLFSGAPDAGSSQTTSTDLKWLATARLRLGTAIGAQAMAYVTGGAALGRVEYNVVTDYVGDPFRYPGSLTKNKLGWTAGGGVEFGLSSNMSLKAEYLYFDLGDNTITANPVAPNAPFQVQTVHDLNGHIVRLGLNIRFGDTAVVARY